MNKEYLINTFKIKIRNVETSNKKNIYNDVICIEDLVHIKKIKKIKWIEEEYLINEDKYNIEKLIRINDFINMFTKIINEHIDLKYNNEFKTIKNKEKEEMFNIEIEKYIEEDVTTTIALIIFLSEDLYNLIDYFITPRLLNNLYLIIKLKELEIKEKEKLKKEYIELEELKKIKEDNNLIDIEQKQKKINFNLKIYKKKEENNKIKIEKWYIRILEILYEDSKNIEHFLLSLPVQISKTFYYTLLKSQGFDRFNKLCILLEGYFALIFNARVNNEKDIEAMQFFFEKIENKLNNKITLGDWVDSIIKLNDKNNFIEPEIIDFMKLFNMDMRNNIKGHGCFSNLQPDYYNNLEKELIKNSKKLRDLNISLKIFNLECKNKDIELDDNKDLYTNIFLDFEDEFGFDFENEFIFDFEKKPTTFEKLGFCLIKEDLILTFKCINLNNEIEYYNFSNQNYKQNFKINYKDYKNKIFENLKIENYEKTIEKEKDRVLNNFKKNLGKELLGLSSNEIKSEFEVENLKINIERDKNEIYTTYKIKGKNKEIDNNKIVLKSYFNIFEQNHQKELKKELFNLEDIIKNKDKENIFKKYIELIKKDIKVIKIILNLD